MTGCAITNGMSKMKTHNRNAFGLLLILMLACASVQAQQNYYVDITNQTGYTIMYVYVSPGDARSWEEDVLGSEVMPSGTSKRISLFGYRSPIFDVRLVDEDGDTYTFWNVDVSRNDLVVTLANLD